MYVTYFRKPDQNYRPGIAEIHSAVRHYERIEKNDINPAHGRSLRSVYGTFSLRMRSSRAYFS